MKALAPSYQDEAHLREDLFAQVPALIGPFTRDEVIYVIQGVLRGEALSDLSAGVTPSTATLARYFAHGTPAAPLLNELYTLALAMRADERLADIGQIAKDARTMDKDDVPAANLRLKALTTLLEKEDPRRFGRNAKEDTAAEMIAKEVVRRWVTVPEKELSSGDDRDD